jgi:hypothetical protein
VPENVPTPNLESRMHFLKTKELSAFGQKHFRRAHCPAGARFIEGRS